MRLAVVVVLLLIAACNSAGTTDPASPESSLPPECPRGLESPSYCFAGALGTAESCGACASVGETCDYFEATLVCACDHQWRCAWAGGSSGGCRSPDGGAICN